MRTEKYIQKSDTNEHMIPVMVYDCGKESKSINRTSSCCFTADQERHPSPPTNHRQYLFQGIVLSIVRRAFDVDVLKSTPFASLKYDAGFSSGYGRFVPH